MELRKEQATERFVELVQRMYVQVRPSAPEEWSDLELTMLQFRTLVLLSQGPQRMGNIAAHLVSSLSSATSMVDRLVEKGLVEREPDPDDRRVVICQLTSQGLGEIERFWRISRMRIVDMVSHLTASELQRVVEAMELLYQAGDRARERL